jgi:hypothetical protein
MHDGPGGSGLSRKAVLEQVDESLTGDEAAALEKPYVESGPSWY